MSCLLRRSATALLFVLLSSLLAACDAIAALPNHPLNDSYHFYSENFSGTFHIDFPQDIDHFYNERTGILALVSDANALTNAAHLEAGDWELLMYVQPVGVMQTNLLENILPTQEPLTLASVAEGLVQDMPQYREQISFGALETLMIGDKQGVRILGTSEPADVFFIVVDLGEGYLKVKGTMAPGTYSLYEPLFLSILESAEYAYAQ